MDKTFGCLLTFWIGYLIGVLALGAWSVNVCLSYFGKNIHWVGDFLLGLIVGGITIPVAIVGSILKAFGVF